MQRSAAQAGGDAGAGASLNLSLRGKVAKGRTGTGTTREPQPTASSARARRPKPRPARPHVFSALGLVTLVGRLDCIGHRCWGRFWIGFERRRRSDTLVRRLRRLRRWLGAGGIHVIFGRGVRAWTRGVRIDRCPTFYCRCFFLLIIEKSSNFKYGNSTLPRPRLTPSPDTTRVLSPSAPLSK
jgi:hypothetical protein